MNVNVNVNGGCFPEMTPTVQRFRLTPRLCTREGRIHTKHDLDRDAIRSRPDSCGSVYIAARLSSAAHG